MLFKLRCGCVVLIVEQEHDADNDNMLMKVVARTLDYCGSSEEGLDFGLDFRNPVTYDRLYNNIHALPAQHDVWDKIQDGHPLTAAETEAYFQKINELLADGYKFQQIQRLLKQNT